MSCLIGTSQSTDPLLVRGIWHGERSCAGFLVAGGDSQFIDFIHLFMLFLRYMVLDLFTIDFFVLYIGVVFKVLCIYFVNWIVNRLFI